MTLFKILIPLTVFIHLGTCKDGILSIELNIPSFINSLIGLDNSLKNFRASIGSSRMATGLSLAFAANNGTDNKKVHGEILMNSEESTTQDPNNLDVLKVNVKGLNDAANILKAFRRTYLNTPDTQYMLKYPNLINIINERRSQSQIKPYVELAPGSIKTEIVTYPPKFLEGRLLHLLKIKEKKEKELNG